MPYYQRVGETFKIHTTGKMLILYNIERFYLIMHHMRLDIYRCGCFNTAGRIVGSSMLLILRLEAEYSKTAVGSILNVCAFLTVVT